jgi:Ala-tRNA(Pro) deacylase
VTRPLYGRVELEAYLMDRGIAFRTVDHAPVFRVSEGAELKQALPGAHTKNLFLKDAKGRLWLVSARSDAKIDLKTLPGQIGSARLSFGSEERLWAALGVRPGSVTAFSLVNDPQGAVTFVLDQGLLDCELLNFHPLRNDATTAISRDDFLIFLEGLGRRPLVIEFPAA